ncbi:MAG: ATP-binding protein [Polyangiaceae bacterium]|nr:ATP-binding protein [Myxococcales bacterium]MCB9587369.1 ATP-binding protein [Polyangiaceae bacterium]MCB9605834.1 ATP-binding protein [Polyangiaceae bacterium]
MSAWFGDSRTVSSLVVLQVPSEIVFRDLATRTVAAVCKLATKDASVGEQFGHELVSAVGEAFNNSVLHAYENHSGEITLRITYDDCQVSVEILDHGDSFDFDAAPELDLAEPQESGMGLFIIRSFVDEVSYEPGSPNCLRMKKRFA